MNAQTQEILQAAMALPPDDRSLVADLLYGSLNTNSDQAAVDQAWDEEIASRIRDVDDGKTELLPMNDVEKRLREKGVLWE